MTVMRTLQTAAATTTATIGCLNSSMAAAASVASDGPQSTAFLIRRVPMSVFINCVWSERPEMRLPAIAIRRLDRATIRQALGDEVLGVQQTDCPVVVVLFEKHPALA